jgi:hypothetical protein
MKLQKNIKFPPALSEKGKTLLEPVLNLERNTPKWIRGYDLIIASKTSFHYKSKILETKLTFIN